ncbi:hypothetical protein [Actinoplanes italicus]|uniref:hypothetical protein n=1 Tax=Actinoplanes italicus TaxID=113567 RepID=UPI000D061F67|nr:hypothetical protein [Actinoplanes italicus]
MKAARASAAIGHGRHQRQIRMSAAMIQSMKVRVAAVYAGVPTMVDAMLAGTRVTAEWVGPRPAAGDVADVELGIDEALKWGHSIAVDDDQLTLREGPRLRGTVEMQKQDLLTIRIAEGLAEVEVDDPSIDVRHGTAVALVVGPVKLYPTGT